MKSVPFQPVVFERTDQAAAALSAGRCDTFGTDASQLAAVRSTPVALIAPSIG